ncbi:two-component response regulator-like PRR37 isoform X2 [Olea europaea var. sylvestris]|uniref:two-component response regulator-like PRR37 isoform X2 n=1 Tax=Olea europaea var. sylvestris TaxID=158386 RepID=UPI000C1D36F0|nr:two-component response regulator-like PRR37 isoform X2 [Olea europaea var. sylvestris]
MRGFRVDTDASPANGLEELNYHLTRDNQNEVRNKATSDTLGTLEEEESRINGDSDYLSVRDTDLVQTQVVSQTQQLKPQGPQGSVVHWERLLPLRSVKVLLVENDESTRHVVSALLRNCSYEVTAVAHGLEAWKILEDPTNHIDLVLTEVAMPYLSGIGLLSMIMNHKTSKNIPVIMMSSNDSMGIVFKCLSKGAADFLVKPIRKNELKTLWQHVWRKCHSSSGSGSGSESGIRTQKSPKSKSEELDNYAASNDDDDDSASIGLNVQDGSENGSGSETQSSWSRRAVEIDGPQPSTPCNELAGPPNTTLAQASHSRPEAKCNNRVSTSTREYRNQDAALDLKIGVPNAQELRSQRCGVLSDTPDTEKSKNLNPYSSKDCNRPENGKMDPKNEIPYGALTNKDCGLMSAITNVPKHRMRNVSNEVPKHPSEVAKIKETATYDPKEKPTLEFSLKQLRDTDDTGTSAYQHNVLKHSNLSAFSRYNSTTNAMPTGNVGSCSPINNSSEAAKTELATPNQGSNGSSNNNDMGSTTDNVFAKVEAGNEKTVPKSSVGIHPCSALQSVQQVRMPIQPVNPGKSNLTKSALAPMKASDQQAQVQNHHHHHHHHHHYHHHHHAYDAQQRQQQQLLNHDYLSLKLLTAEAPQHGPSDELVTELEGNAANYGSASGSNNGSNGQNGVSTVAITEGTNMASDNGTIEQYEVGDGSGSGSRSRVDQNRSAQREAALSKFYQKRKERCFEKKVRYQSRKKLAEQRPRVRGQFVRRVTDDNQSKSETRDTDS